MVLRIADTSLTSYLWSAIEPSAAICGACITTYRPLFAYFNVCFRSASRIRKPTRPRTAIGYDSRGSCATVNAANRGHSMQWPVARDFLGNPLVSYKEVESGSRKSQAHIVDVALSSTESHDSHRDEEGFPKSPASTSMSPV